jgi:hypothetical protein
MSIEHDYATDPHLQAAVAELQSLIHTSYPSAVFDVAPGDDPAGLYLTATVDVEDTDEVFEIVVGRLLEMQVEEELPVYVIPVRPLARVVAEPRAGKSLAPRAPVPV